MNAVKTRRFPAEWEEHEATWVGWPHQQKDWPGYFESIELDVAEIIRLLSPFEKVNIVCKDTNTVKRARKVCKDFHCTLMNCKFHIIPTDRTWFRDSAPTALWVDEKLRWIGWDFKAWGECYKNYKLDRWLPDAIAKITDFPLEIPLWEDGTPVQLEGGAIETNGLGLLVTTEECLIGGEHPRNPGKTKRDYERMFKKYLGIDEVLWLGQGFQPDQTQGHVDNVARFTYHEHLLVATPIDAADPNFEIRKDNQKRIDRFQRKSQRPLVITDLPFTREPVYRKGQRLPSNYINFYIGNDVVIVPVFNDENDRLALEIIQERFMGRRVIGRYSRNIVWGYGNDHCLLQQQPL